MKKAVIDIDGVLNNYPQTFINFCNNELHTSFETLSEIKEKLSYTDYKHYKNEYRQSDFKHNAKLTDGAIELFEYLKNNNYLIYIVTSRQLFVGNQLENTILWLKKNKLEYDYIYCSIKKDFTIFEKFGHIDLVVEDNVDNINKIKAINDDCLFINVVNKDNSDIEYNGIRVNNLYEAIKEVRKYEN